MKYIGNLKILLHRLFNIPINKIKPIQPPVIETRYPHPYLEKQPCIIKRKQLNPLILIIRSFPTIKLRVPHPISEEIRVMGSSQEHVLPKSHYECKSAKRINECSNGCNDDELHATHFRCPIEDVVLVPGSGSLLRI